MKWELTAAFDVEGDLDDDALADRVAAVITEAGGMVGTITTANLRTCRVCGCTDDQACVNDDGPCSWIEADLCSACRTIAPPKCIACGRERGIEDAYDYNPLQVITGQPVGWYSGDDGELCPECMAKTLSGQVGGDGS